MRPAFCMIKLDEIYKICSNPNENWVQKCHKTSYWAAKTQSWVFFWLFPWSPLKALQDTWSADNYVNYNTFLQCSYKMYKFRRNLRHLGSRGAGRNHTNWGAVKNHTGRATRQSVEQWKTTQAVEQWKTTQAAEQWKTRHGVEQWKTWPSVEQWKATFWAPLQTLHHSELSGTSQNAPHKLPSKSQHPSNKFCGHSKAQDWNKTIPKQSPDRQNIPASKSSHWLVRKD